MPRKTASKKDAPAVSSKKKRVNGKAKGNVGERDLANWLKARGILSARRTQQYSADAGDSDVVAPDELPKVFFESKFYKTDTLGIETLKSWAKRLLETCPEDQLPVIFFRSNRQKWVAMVFVHDMSYFAVKDLDSYHWATYTDETLSPAKNLSQITLALKRELRDWWARGLWERATGLDHYAPRDLTGNIPALIYPLNGDVGFFIVDGEHMLDLLKYRYGLTETSPFECTVS